LSIKALYGTRRCVIESLAGMTSTIKRRIAREWLIFLACVVIGLVVSYFAFYFPSGHYESRLVDVSKSEEKQLNADYYKVGFIPDGYQRVFDRSLYLKNGGNRNDKYDDLIQAVSYVWKREVPVYRRKNPGDLFNDLWPIIRTYYHPRRYKWDEQAVKLWLCILTPYLGFCFLRSVIWSVNTLRRH
jgi:hypothetical protein